MYTVNSLFRGPGTDVPITPQHPTHWPQHWLVVETIDYISLYRFSHWHSKWAVVERANTARALRGVGDQFRAADSQHGSAASQLKYSAIEKYYKKHKKHCCVGSTQPRSLFTESVATLPPFGPIEGQKWFDQISSQWESQKNRFALTYFGKIQFLPPCIWNLLFVSTASGQIFTLSCKREIIHTVRNENLGSPL